MRAKLTLFKIVLTTIAVFVGSFFFFGSLYVVFSNVNTWIISVFPDYGDWREWWYDCVNSGYVYYIIASACLSSSACLIWQITTRLIHSAVGTLVYGGIGFAALIVANNVFWEFVIDRCNTAEYGHAAMDCYRVVFGSVSEARLYFSAAMCFVFAVGVVLHSVEFFTGNKVKKTALRQVFSNRTLFFCLLWFVVPAYSFGIGAFKWARYEMNTVLKLSLPLILVVATAKELLKFSFVRKLTSYYSNTIYNIQKPQPLLIIRESLEENSAIFHEILQVPPIMRQLQEHDIRVLPAEIREHSQAPYIILDLLYSQEFMYTELQEYGTFNIFVGDDVSDHEVQEVGYDFCAADLSAAIPLVISLSKALPYRKKLTELLDNMSVHHLTETNILVDELVAFSDYLQKCTDPFLVFDFSIKWLEIINYFYSLVSVCKNECKVTNSILKKIEMADFDRWRDMRRSFAKNATVDQILNKTVSDRTVFTVFSDLWRIVVARDYVFVAYSIAELLQAANRLRDYTRGHGIFTFEITWDVNTALAEIVTFLAGELVKNNLLSCDFEKLQDLGWVLYKGDIPYFLYTYDRKHRECRFDSFQGGNSLSLPVHNEGRS